jgi:hypothetical protein
MQDTFRALLPNISISFQSRSGPALEHDNAVEYNLFAGGRSGSQNLFRFSADYNDFSAVKEGSSGLDYRRYQHSLQPRSHDLSVPDAKLSKSPYVRQPMH